MRMGQNRRRVLGPRLRQGVKPPRIRPTSRASGWARCRTKTTVRNARALRLRARNPTKWVRATETAAWATGRAIARHAPAIDAAEPAQPAEGVVSRRPLFLQQRFRLSVPDLLLPVRSKVATTMVPDDRRGGIADDLASVPEPPTDVDIVSRG